MLTVGAFTERMVISDPTYAGWSALGAAGDIMPRSRTSVSRIREWPIKPDVVFEGGNIGYDPATGQGDHVDDLALLTTYRAIAERPFTTTGDTSAATALAARMAAQILVEKPALWPEISPRPHRSFRRMDRCHARPSQLHRQACLRAALRFWRPFAGSRAR